MIPKIIHYSWFSTDPMPKHIQELMTTWKKWLPDYELRLWDGKALAEINCTYANEAVSVKKWAFAADFLRNYVVYKYGGIWLDTDIEVFKSFDPFLHHKMFIGAEANFHGIPKQRCVTSHVFGAEAGHPFLKLCVDYYMNRHFIHSYCEELPWNLRLDCQLILPEIHCQILRENFGYNSDGYLNPNIKQILKDDIHVYPYYYFDSPRYRSMDGVICIHRALGGWRPTPDAGKPNYSLTNSKKKSLRYCIFRIYDAFNAFAYKYWGFGISKGKR